VTGARDPFSGDEQLELLWKALPQSRADKRVVEDAAQKRARLRTWLKQKGLSGVVISRRDNFAWLTSGGDSRVLNSSELGFGHLVITADRAFLVAYSMDAGRLFEEQLVGQGYELLAMHWHEGEPRQRALGLAGGKSVIGIGSWEIDGVRKAGSAEDAVALCASLMERQE